MSNCYLGVFRLHQNQLVYLQLCFTGKKIQPKALLFNKKKKKYFFPHFPFLGVWQKVKKISLVGNKILHICDSQMRKEGEREREKNIEHCEGERAWTNFWICIQRDCSFDLLSTLVSTFFPTFFFLFQFFLFQYSKFLQSIFFYIFNMYLD